MTIYIDEKQILACKHYIKELQDEINTLEEEGLPDIDDLHYHQCLTEKLEGFKEALDIIGINLEGDDILYN